MSLLLLQYWRTKRSVVQIGLIHFSIPQWSEHGLVILSHLGQELSALLPWVPRADHSHQGVDRQAKFFRCRPLGRSHRNPSFRPGQGYGACKSLQPSYCISLWCRWRLREHTRLGTLVVCDFLPAPSTWAASLSTCRGWGSGPCWRGLRVRDERLSNLCR